MHSSADVDANNEKEKTEMILFHNANKVGVDCFDQMARLYTTRSASRKWPVAVWRNILDIAAINSYVLHKKITSNPNTAAVHTNACGKSDGQATTLSEQQQ